MADLAVLALSSYQRSRAGNQDAATRPADFGCEGVLMEYPYFYAWNRMGRKGQFFRVIFRGTMNSCLIEFEDGFRAVTSRNAIRKRKDANS
jgi:hypothetical protein